MAFLRTARALVVHPSTTQTAWSKVRTAKVGGQPSQNLIEQASEILGKPFDPNDYLLTHSTIVASVDVEDVPGVKLGSVRENGKKINRKYANYRVTAETDQYINNNCFPPNTPILMGDGTLKPIENVAVGDDVITHLGRVRKVTRTYTNPFDGNLLEFKYRASNERVYVTPEHPLFVIRPLDGCTQCGKKFEHNHKCVSALLNKFYCSTTCSFKNGKKKSALLQEKSGEFIPASQVRHHLDFATMPIVSDVVSVPLTLGQARLIGYFLAEGWYATRTHADGRRVGVCWGLHKNEESTLAQTIIDLMQAEFGVDCKIIGCSNTENGIRVVTNTSPESVAFFERWVSGKDARTKLLHPDIVRAPLDVQVEVLRAWFEGDGSSFDTQTEDVVGDIRMVGTTASRSLASQLRLMLHRVGVSPQWIHVVAEGRKRLVVDGEMKLVGDPTKECHSWTLSCGGGYIADLVETTYYQDAYHASVDRRGGLQAAPTLRFLNGHVLQMIEFVGEVEYRGLVHNLEVEDDHSYVAGGLSVHNCDSFSREVLLKSYRTFVGGQNFCFAPGTRILMKDGTYRPIEDVCVGDVVVTHTGEARAVVHTFERDYDGLIQAVHVDRFDKPILATANHPFRTIVVKAPPLTSYDDAAPLVEMNVGAEKDWVSAGVLIDGMFLLGAENKIGNGCRVHRVASNEVVPYRGKVYNLEVDADQSYVVYPGIAVHNCEHVQIEDLSKGRIIDAVARDIGDSVYIDILIATDKKHTQLIDDIVSEKMGTLSMGCSVAETTCTKCGNVAIDETQTCECIRYNKGNVFLDERGKRHRVAEICGHPSIDPVGGVTFIEASWVESPAFTGAVMRNIISPDTLSAKAAQQVQAILSTPPPQWVDDGMAKAAARQVTAFDFGDAPDEAPAATPAPAGDEFDDVEDRVMQMVLDRVEKRVKDKLDKKDDKPEQSAAAPNDTLIKEASKKVAMDAYRASVETMVRVAVDVADLVDKVAELDRSFGICASVEIYRTALAAGSISKYASEVKFLGACQKTLGRSLTRREGRILTRIGNILNLAEKTNRLIRDNKRSLR